MHVSRYGFNYSNGEIKNKANSFSAIDFIILLLDHFSLTR